MKEILSIIHLQIGDDASGVYMNTTLNKVNCCHSVFIGQKSI